MCYLLNFHLSFSTCAAQLKDDTLIRSHCLQEASRPKDIENFLKAAKDYETFVPIPPPVRSCFMRVYRNTRKRRAIYHYKIH